MRNPGGRGLSRGHPVSFRKGRRDRRAAEKPRLKPACSREEPPPWSPKESPSPPGLGLRTKLGVGLFTLLIDLLLQFRYKEKSRTIIWRRGEFFASGLSINSPSEKNILVGFS